MSSLEKLTDRLKSAYEHGGVNDADSALPDRESMQKACASLMSLLFPGFFTAEPVAKPQLEAHTMSQLMSLQSLLLEQAARAMRYAARAKGHAEPMRPAESARELVRELLDELVDVRGLVETDIEAAFASDPAALDRETIVLSYPCIEVLAVQRFAHRMYRRGLPILPRMMTEIVHSRTGIDIHPGAAIDESFFIDHGTGVVIGETSRIGKRCVLYQGVGLVAWNPLVKDENGELQRGQANKRHPDLEDRVTVYAGATILGGDTVVGHHSVIGGNVWLTHSVEPYSSVTINDPELKIRKRQPKPSVRVPRQKRESKD